MRDDELFAAAKELRAPVEVVKQTAELGALPVPNFSAGGVATPADASLMRQLGAEAVFVGSGIFKSEDPRALLCTPRRSSAPRRTTTTPTSWPR